MGARPVATTIVRWAPVISGLLLAAGCADLRGEQVRLAQTALIGLPKDALLACAGHPERSSRRGKIDRLTYYNPESIPYRSSWNPVANQPLPAHWPGTFGGGDKPDSIEEILERQRCEATFTLESDVVTGVTYEPHFMASQSDCASIVASCLAWVAYRPVAAPTAP